MKDVITFGFFKKLITVAMILMLTTQVLAKQLYLD